MPNNCDSQDSTGKSIDIDSRAMIQDQAVDNAKCIQYYRETPNHVLQSHRSYTHSGSLYCYAESEIRLLGSVDNALDSGL